MSKQDFYIETITKEEAKAMLDKYHYLRDPTKKIKYGVYYGLFTDKVEEWELVGCITFTALPVPELATSMFGLDRTDQEGLFELNRLVLAPRVQQTEHNLASWFVARALKLLRKRQQVRAVLSYADSAYHEGIVYKACNFTYHGLTKPKKDFWIKQPDGTYKKHVRGKLKHLEGKWVKRSSKHRYLMVYDKTLTVKWPRRRIVGFFHG